ncbi:MAG: ParA family protein [Xenococcaceae cyanobacterium]
MQKVLTLISNAGGVGKTTLALNLAYIASQKGKSVVIIDLDNNLSLNDFTGLKQAPYEESIERIFHEDFDGQWNLTSIFDSDGKVSIVRGSDRFEPVLWANQKRREYILRKQLKKYPLDCDLVIFDNRGGFDLIIDNGLAAATHILIPARVGAKINTIPRLIEKIWNNVTALELPQNPNLLGVVPNECKKQSSVHRTIMDTLKEELKKQQVKLYPEIPHNAWICNSNTWQIPISAHRPGDFYNQTFVDIVQDLFS